MHRPAAGLALGYLAFSVRKPDAWATFAETMLGLPAPLLHEDGSRGYRIDDRSQPVRQRSRNPGGTR